MKQNVLITGGSGLIGQHLIKNLLDQGYRISVLSRSPSNDPRYTSYKWDINKKIIDSMAVQKADHIIHLAGANIADKRWTAVRKNELFDSRIRSTSLLIEELKRQNKKLESFISASAIGYYGAVTSNQIFKEIDPPASDFIGNLCAQWEDVVSQISLLGIRTVKFRTGIVLTNKGGALSKIKWPIKYGIGSALGSGKQWVPWVHIEDLCRLYIRAITEVEMIGTYNAVAPSHITNNEMNLQISSILKKPYFMPKIPKFILKILLGELSTVLLYGSRVSSEKIMKEGFLFNHPKLEGALQNLLINSKNIT